MPRKGQSVAHNSGCRYCIYRSKPGVYLESTVKHLLDRVAYNHTYQCPTREYIVTFRDLHGCLVSAVKVQNKREFQHTKSQAC
jgi:hypothetical protein